MSTTVLMPQDGILNMTSGCEQARLDVKEGRVLSYDSLDDFINEIENG